jgi:Cys-tRNA(Pro)/Cys-tRNA(Cys) deacylase
MTRAVAYLQDRGVSFEIARYEYQSSRSIGLDAAKAIGVDPGSLYKTLVFYLDQQPALVLIDAAHRVSIRQLGRVARADVTECAPAEAERFTGYKVGGISPFATRRRMKTYVDDAIASREQVYVNAGARGVLVVIKRQALIESLVEPSVAKIRDGD